MTTTSTRRPRASSSPFSMKKSGPNVRESVQPADMAIIGLACRFPAAASPGEFWSVLRDGLEVTRPAGEENGTGQPREGMLDNVAEFDADFFNVSPREACA